MSLVRNKKLIITTLVLSAVAVITILLTSKSSDTYKIIDREYSICTGDVPSSSCGSYEVNVKSAGGKELTLTVPGFDNRKSKKYDEITSKINNAKQDSTSLKLEVNNQQEITSASE